LNLNTGNASAFFFAEHSTNTGNTVLLICGEQIGMNAANLLVDSVDMDVVAQDFYFGGPGDLVEGLTVTRWANVGSVSRKMSLAEARATSTCTTSARSRATPPSSG